MARAIITREIEYTPSNPHNKQHRVKIDLINQITIFRKIGHLHDGHTLISLKSGRKYFSSDGVFEVCRAYQEAKGE